MNAHQTRPLCGATCRQMWVVILSPALTDAGQRSGKNSGNQENMPSEKLR